MAARYWVGGTGTWDNVNTANWSTTSGGAGGASAPVAADTAHFDSLSGSGTVTATTTTKFGTCNLNNAGITILLSGAVVAGSLNLTAGIWDCSTFDFNGGQISMNGGTFTTTSGTVDCALYISNTATAKTVSLGTATLVGTLEFVAGGSGLTLNDATAFYRTSTIRVGAGWDVTLSDVTMIASSGNLIVNSDPVIPIKFGKLTLIGITLAALRGYYLLEIEGGSTGTSAKINVTNLFTIEAPVVPIYQRWLITNIPGASNVEFNAAAIAGLDDVDFFCITGGGAASWVGTRLGNCGGNSGITFDAPKTVYWNGGNVAWTTTSWATSDGGATAAVNFPLAQDTAIFTNTNPPSNGFVTLEGYNLPNITSTARTLNGAFIYNFNKNIMRGNILSGTGGMKMTTSSNGELTVTGPPGTTLNLVTGGNNVEWYLFVKTAGTLRLNSNFASDNNNGMRVEGGTLTVAPGASVTIDKFYSVPPVSYNPSVINMGNSNWFVGVSSTTTGQWQTGTGCTVNSATSTIRLGGSTTATFSDSANSTFNNLTRVGGTGTTITCGGTSITFTTLDYITPTAAQTFTFTSGKTFNITNFSIDGTASFAALLRASTAGSRTTFNKLGGGTVTASYLDIKDNQGLPVSTWNAINSIDSGNNLNWFITGPAGTSGGNFFLIF